jgi:hypothetical protein
MCESEIIHLAADLSFFHTDYLWKIPGSWSGYPYYSSPEFYEDIARMASRGVMDLLFFGDSAGTPEEYGGNHHAAIRYGVKWPWHDMMPMIPCMARGLRTGDGVDAGLPKSHVLLHSRLSRAGPGVGGMQRCAQPQAAAGALAAHDA